MVFLARAGDARAVDGHAASSRHGALTPVVRIVELEANRDRVGTRRETAILRWRTGARRLGARVEHDRLSAGQTLDLQGVDALVLPDQERLSGVHAEEIEAFLAAGGGLVITGRTGSMDANGTPRSPTLLQRWLPGSGLRGLSGPHFFVRAATRGPLVAGLPPGARLDVRVPEGALAAPGPGALDWSRHELSSSGGAAALDGVKEKGAVVWLALGAADVIEEEAALRLVTNALRRSLRWPIAELLPWPGARRVAVVVAADVEHGFEKVADVAGVLERRRVPSTFLLVSDLAREHPALVARLARIGEIASHTDDHTPLAGLPESVQRAHLRRSKKTLERLTGESVVGLRPPEERWDEASLRALAATGYRYLAPGDIGRASPSLLEVEGRTLVLIPRAVGDDFLYLASDPALGEEELLADLLRDFEAVERAGGLYTFSYHSHWLADGHVSVLDRLIAELVTREAWIVTARDLADWWLQRAAVSLEVAVRGSRELDIALHNPGEAPVIDLAVRIHVPEPALRPRAHAQRLLLRTPRLRVASDRSWVDVIVPRLGPGGTARYRLRY